MAACLHRHDMAGAVGASKAHLGKILGTPETRPLDEDGKRTSDLRLEMTNGRLPADFAKLLGCNTIGMHIGFVPHDQNDPLYAQIVAVTREVCDYIKQNGQQLNLETGQESADGLLAFIGDVQRDNLFINFDPANMILYGTGEPIAALKKVGKYVRSVHCKDGKWAKNPGQEWGQEVPLGQGDVGMENYLRTLKEIGYTGPLTIEREIPQDPVRQKAEIGGALELLSSLKKKILS